jgi:hypothetical protein
VEFVRSLFSFRGEISRGRLWLIWLAVGVGCLPVQLALMAASRVVGDHFDPSKLPGAWKN